MNVKKSIAVAISMVLITLTSPLSLTADNSASAETEIWDGTYDTSWYDEEETELHISTVEELAGLSELVNAGHTMEGQTIYLDNDIYLNDVSDFESWRTEIPNNQWKSIGGKIGYYYFDGQGRTVIGAYIDAANSPHESWVGFFGITGTNACVCNLNLDYCYVEGGASYLKYTAGICAYNRGAISNCSFDGTINKVSTMGLDRTDLISHCGAICAFNESGDISGCMVNGDVTVDIYIIMKVMSAEFVATICQEILKNAVIRQIFSVLSPIPKMHILTVVVYADITIQSKISQFQLAVITEI